MVDHFVAGLYKNRVAQAHATASLLGAWSGSSPMRRAAMVYAQGDSARAAACGGKLWKQFVEGDLAGVLDEVKGSKDVHLNQLEAEVLIAAGSIMPGLERLQRLSQRGEPAAVLSLVRRLNILGDHRGAVHIASSMPWNAHVALIGAKSAVMAKEYEQARRLVEPFLSGMAPIPEATVAAGMAVITASLLAGIGESSQLKDFARRLLLTGDLSEEMLPASARIAWMAGYGKEAWKRFQGKEDQWHSAACLELAVLAGNVSLAKSLASKAGPFAAPALATIPLLDGTIFKQDDKSRQLFTQDNKIHIWKTHPNRWQPWIRSALQTGADIGVFDLSEGKVPATDDIPHFALDDASLVEFMLPVSVPPAASAKDLLKERVWIESELCQDMGVDFAWPEEETRRIRQSMNAGDIDEPSSIKVLSADSALVAANAGYFVVAIATPGDPFWNGPLPQRAWTTMRVIRIDNQNGWASAGQRVVEAAREFIDMAEAAVQKSAAASVDDSTKAGSQARPEQGKGQPAAQPKKLAKKASAQKTSQKPAKKSTRKPKAKSRKTTGRKK